jgi:thioredoxin 1
MSSFTTVNEDDFSSQVLNSPSPVIVEFGAEWCAPCKRLEPIMEKLGVEWGNKVVLVKMDVDQCGILAASLHVLSVPTLILFFQGKEQQRLVGLQSREKILEKFSVFL